MLIEATEKGVSLLREGHLRRVKFLAGTLARLSAAELAGLEHALSALEKALH